MWAFLPKSAAAFAAITASAVVFGSAPAHSVPAEFPDVDSYPAVDLTEYQILGAHPSMSGWSFSTPSGLRCQNSLIAELGVFCRGPIPGAPEGADGVGAVGVSLTHPAEFSESGIDPSEPLAPMVPTGSKIAADNGVVCAVLTDDTLACRAAKPTSWPSDTPDPPDKHYSEHGFVVSPSRSWGF